MKTRATKLFFFIENWFALHFILNSEKPTMEREIETGPTVAISSKFWQYLIPRRIAMEIRSSLNSNGNSGRVAASFWISRDFNLAPRSHE